MRRGMLAFAIVLVMGGGWCARTVAAQRSSVVLDQKGSETYEVPNSELERHEIWPHRPVRPGHAVGAFDSVHLSVIVDAQGNVVSATPVSGPSDAYAAAVAEAMKWKYVPFEKGGVATRATFDDDVRLLPPERLPTRHEPFPEITSSSNVVMKLSRSGCFGTCPAYSIEIHGDGAVNYSGGYFVVVRGEHRDHLSATQIKDLIEAFRAADYFSLDDKYTSPATDLPTFVTSLRVDQVAKSVVDYWGSEVGMPQAVTDLEETIERVTNTRKWIAGTAETVPTLKNGGFDFSSTEAAALLARAAKEGSTVVVKDLLALRVEPNGQTEDGRSALAAAAGARDREAVELLIQAGAGKGNPKMKTEALGAAASVGDAELVKRLLAYGGKANGEIRNGEESQTVLMQAASSGVPDVVKLILAGHPHVNARDKKGQTAVRHVVEGNDYWDEERHADRAEVIRLLVTAGANVNARDEDGETALHEALDDDVVKALIKAGANVNVRNNNGETPLMTNVSVEVLKILVAAGADIHARDTAGRSVLGNVLQYEKSGPRVEYLRSLGIEETQKR